MWCHLVPGCFAAFERDFLEFYDAECSGRYLEKAPYNEEDEFQVRCACVGVRCACVGVRCACVGVRCACVGE